MPTSSRPSDSVRALPPSVHSGARLLSHAFSPVPDDVPPQLCVRLAAELAPAVTAAVQLQAAAVKHGKLSTPRCLSNIVNALLPVIEQRRQIRGCFCDLGGDGVCVWERGGEGVGDTTPIVPV